MLIKFVLFASKCQVLLWELQPLAPHWGLHARCGQLGSISTTDSRLPSGPPSWSDGGTGGMRCTEATVGAGYIKQLLRPPDAPSAPATAIRGAQASVS